MHRLDDQRLFPLREAMWAVRQAKHSMKSFGYGGHEEDRWPTWYLARCLLNFDCVDNLSVVRLEPNGSPFFFRIAAYLKAREKGCCGRWDELITSGNTLYLIGFNYGH